MTDNNLKLIKLCKSSEPAKSLVEFYKEEYDPTATNSEAHYAISMLLMEVLEKHIPFNLTDIVVSLHPSKAHHCPDESYNFRMMYTLMHQIRHCEIKKIKQLDLDALCESSFD